MAGKRGTYLYDEDGNIIGATGGLKAAMTNKLRYGDTFYQVAGKLGGSKKTDKPKGFAYDHKLASEAGRVGGLVSKRSYKFLGVSEDTGEKLYLNTRTKKIVRFK